MLHKIRQKNNRRIGLIALFGLAGLVMIFAWAGGTANAQETVGMALRIEGAGVSCDDATCDVPLGGDFTLAIQTAGPPSEGYIAVQTNLYYGGLIYNATASAEDENVWPDNRLPVRFPPEPDAEARAAAHGGLTSITQPFTLSTFEGDLVVLSMTCTSENETFTVALLTYEAGTNPLGSSYSTEDQTTAPINVQSVMRIDPDNQGDVIELPVGDTINVNCGGGGDTGGIIPTVEQPGDGNGSPAAGATLPPPEATEAAAETAESLATAAVEATETAVANATAGTPLAAETPGVSGTPTEADNGDTGVEDDDGDGNTVLWIIIAIIVIAALAVAGVLGWRYWQARQDQAESPE